jgi:hypothetical protein
MITLNIPFLYEAIVIKARCRKESLITIKDHITVEIKETSLNSLPVAFTVGNHSIHWDGETLFSPAINDAEQPLNIAEIIKNTQNNGSDYKYSCSSSSAPFKNFWSNFKYSDITLGHKFNIKSCGFDKHITDTDVIEKSDAIYRDWIEDNRKAVIAKINDIVNGFISVDNLIYTTANEPLYEVNSFGAGHNYSVAMFVSYGYNPNISNKAYFNSLELEQAKLSFIDRNPNKNASPIPNGGDFINVIIPEAVKYKPLLDHPA